MTDSRKPLSPAKPIMVTPPRPGSVAFFYNPKGRTQGLSPHGKHIIKLNKYEGRHHLKGRDTSISPHIFTGDSPIQSPLKNNHRFMTAKLFMMLENIKNRTDSDYAFYCENNEIDSEHYKASKIKLGQCIRLFKNCYSLSTNSALFINECNNLIDKEKSYNPFRLNLLYIPEDFDSKIYNDACKKVNFKTHISKEDFSAESKKRKHEEIETSQRPNLIPRSVRMKLDLNSQNNQAKKDDQPKISGLGK